jgi:hypothetical protein
MFRFSTVASACILAVLAVLAAAPPASAQPAQPAPAGITTYRETIDLAADGSATVTADIALAGLAASELELPLNVAAADRIAVTADGLAAAAAAVRVGDVRLLRVTFERPPAASQKLRITYAVKNFLDWARSRSPRGIRTLSYTFANLTTHSVADYAVTIVLPPGHLVSGVTSSTPRASGEEIEPPYGFATREGRVEMKLRAKPVAPGKFAAIAFGFVPAERSPLPVLVIAGLLIAAGFYLKHDVLTRECFEAKAAG